ncbi:MAG TPA: extracellular solute-binding protein [Candidatus Binatus sp.]|nr:extracellular solute-binding protein [Candidatus Binatus sp.]
MPVFFSAIICFYLALSPTAYGATGWQDEWERTVKAGEQEGEISYYTVGDFNFLSEFDKKFPRVKVKVVQGRGNELLTRIMAERRGGRFLADVARIGNTSPYALYQAKALQPIAPAFILPEVKDESKWWSGKHQYIDSEGKYIFVPVGSVSVNMVAYNTELVSPAEITSFWDLLNDKWRGKLVIMDPRSTGYGRSSARTVYFNSQLGAEFLRRLFGEQVVMLSRDYRQAIDWLAQRRFPLLLFSNGDDVLQAKAQGLPVNVFDTAGWKEGGALEPGAFTVAWLDKSPHPNAAKIFINWLLSREGQSAMQRDGGVNDSLRLDIAKSELRPVARRKDGAKYMVTWKEEWIDAEPMQKVVNQALTKIGKRQ